MSPHARLRQLFGFEFPDEFFLFWEFARELQPENPARAFDEAEGITLAGPFDALAGRFDRETPNYDPTLHWRYFGDPPEFVTVLLGHCDGLHWGYVVEEADRGPLGVAGYYAHDGDVSLHLEGPGLFGTVRHQAEMSIEDIELDRAYYEKNDPGYADSRMRELSQLIESIDAFRDRHSIPLPPCPDLNLIDDCNFPIPFPVPDDMGEIAAAVERHLAPLRKSQRKYLRECLHVGRLLWHWHENGSPVVQKCAFGLLDGAYAAQGNDYLRHILTQHDEHRHRPSLDVFD